MERRRVVVTGLGAVTPLGLSAPESWRALENGECGIGPITRYDASAQKVRLAGEVKGFDAEKLFGRQEARRLARFTQFALAAAKEALADGNFCAAPREAEACSVIVSSGIGGQEVTEAEQVRGTKKGFDRVSPLYIPTAISNMAAGQIAIAAGFTGMCTCPVAACAGGTYAVGDAFRHIRDGYAQVCLCGGTESSITPLAVGGFTSMKALSTSRDYERASIPFDRERDGFVMGEGAGILLLEELAHAQARGATIYAEVAGYGATCDAYHMTAPKPDGSRAAAAMKMALADAGIAPEAVQYINAHGTSTRLNDACETAAIREAFGAHADKLMVSSTKAATGHMLGAAGAVEAVFTVMTLREGFVPATIHYRQPDEACALDVVPNQGRKVLVEYAMSNSLGFGGHNGSLLFRRWEG